MQPTSPPRRVDEVTEVFAEGFGSTCFQHHRGLLEFLEAADLGLDFSSAHRQEE
jgi:hypothetical protein